MASQAEGQALAAALADIETVAWLIEHGARLAASARLVWVTGWTTAAGAGPALRRAVPGAATGRPTAFGAAQPALGARLRGLLAPARPARRGRGRSERAAGGAGGTEAGAKAPRAGRPAAHPSGSFAPAAPALANAAFPGVRTVDAALAPQAGADPDNAVDASPEARACGKA